MVDRYTTQALRYSQTSEQSASNNEIRSAATMPDNGSVPEIRRTGSGSFLFGRKRTNEEQEDISRIRAQELQSLYEASDLKDESLNRKGHFKKETTASLSASTMTFKQAADFCAQNQRSPSPTSKKPDPLMTEHERKKFERRKTPSIPHSSAIIDGYAKQAFPSCPKTQQSTSNGIRSVATMPVDGSVPEIQRTGSGSFLFGRKRTNEEQEDISRIRAQELQSLYEASDLKDESLNRKGHFKKETTPSLGASTMTFKQAADLCAQNQRSPSPTSKKPDPLMTEHERKKFERRKTPSIPHSSAIIDGYAKQAFPSSPQQSASNGIRSVTTMPVDGSVPEIQRTGSGSFLFGRKRTNEEQEDISRIRAQELQSLYEVSDLKEESLNRKGNFKKETTMTPSLGANAMTFKQAADLCAQNQRSCIKKKPDPLMTEHERKELKHQQDIERRKASSASLVEASHKSVKSVETHSKLAYSGEMV